MERLNELDLAILHRVANKASFLTDHIAFLKVRDRVVTGIGMYVNFVYSGDWESLKGIDPPNDLLTTNERIEIPNLKYGLGYVVDITEGRINFIEFITYGEEWDGSVPNFHFIS